MARCTSCGTIGPPDAHFCSQCGASVDPTPGRAEWRQVTVLFSDLSGFTALSEQLDSEDLRPVMAPFYEAAYEVVARHGGRVERVIGDSVMAVFGDPVAHEDDAQRAVRAALELHEVVTDLEPPAGIRLAMHSGINTGVVVVGHDGQSPDMSLLGDMVNVAARLEGLSETGQILVGPETKQLIERDFVVEDYGWRALEGRDEPVPVYRIVGPAGRHAVPSRRRADFVGRLAELDILAKAVARARTGEALLVTVQGEPGTGKSRLVEQFRQLVDTDVRWLEGRAYEYAANIPYYAVIDLLNREALIDDGDSSEEAHDKLRKAVSQLIGDEHVDAVMPPLAQLHGFEGHRNIIDREAFRRRLAEAVRSLLEATGQAQPTVVCLQDLHWVDPSTEGLLRDLVNLDVPLLFLCLYRPEFELRAERQITIELDDLSPDLTAELARSLLPGATVPDDLTNFVVSRSDGNPFFAEEIVNSLLETGVIAPQDGKWAFVRPLEDVNVPSTIRGVIAARIDNLSEERRRVLREASVVGRDFLYRIVRRISDIPDHVDGSLQDLTAASLVREKALEPELEYLFNHALTQEVAYEGVLRSERQQLHERVARALEDQLGDRREEYTETIAYHFQRSGSLLESVRYLLASGKRAVERYALDEATQHYRTAYELLVEAESNPALDRLLLELLIDRAFVRYYQFDYRGIHQQWSEHADLPDRVGDDGLKARWLAWWGHVAWAYLADVPGSLRSLREARALAEACGDATALAFALAWTPWTLWYQGPTQAVALLPILEDALRGVPDEADRRYARIKGLGGIGTAAATALDIPTATRASADLLAIGEDTGNLRANSMGHAIAALVELDRGNEHEAIEAMTKARDVGADPVYTQFAAVMRAFLLIYWNRVEEATAEVTESRPVAERAGVLATSKAYDVIESLIHLGTGHLTHGMRGLRAARDEALAGENRYYVTVIDLCIAVLYARIATREVEADLGAALRNPGFVVRHVRGAAKRGRSALERLVGSIDETGFAGFLPVAELELTKLAVHEGRVDDARSHLDGIERAAEDLGDSEILRQAHRLAETARSASGARQ